MLMPNLRFQLRKPQTGTLEPEEDIVYFVQMVQPLVYYISVNLTSKALSQGQRWRDSGCARGLGGARQHKALAQVYGQCNLCLVAERCNNMFQVGNGNTEQAMLLKVYLVFIHVLYRGSIHQAVVRSNCPMFLNKAVLSDWDDDVWMGRNEITLNHCNVTIPFIGDKVLVIDNLGVDIGSLRRGRAKTPKWYKLSDRGHWASSEKEYFTEN